MPLVFAAITPHGSIISGTPGAEAATATSDAMEEVSRRLHIARPETLVVITPHGIRVDGAFAVSLSERAAGTLDDPIQAGDDSTSVTVDLPVDIDLARDVLRRADEEGVATVGAHYGATSGPSDCYPLDWGAVVPLWFLSRAAEPQPHVVLAVPSRQLSLERMVAFGRAIAAAAASTDRRVALIASADMAHAHREDGPYGYDPAAAQFDAWITDAVREGDLRRLLDADMELVRRACPDGLWQSLVLAGALERVPLCGELLSYECPTYYGMLVATYS